MLTRKQSELLTYLSDHMQQHDVPPSFDEMRDALGLASKSGVHRLVSGLEERGYIRRLANRARAHIRPNPAHLTHPLPPPHSAATLPQGPRRLLLVLVLWSSAVPLIRPCLPLASAYLLC